MLRIAVLGRLSLEQDERPLSPPVGRPAWLLLGWLALHPGVHSRAAVAGQLWPDVLDDSARGSLRVALVDLRRALGGIADRVLLATREQIGLIDSPELEVDARRFTELRDAGRTSEALALWRAELLDGLDTGDWLVELRDEYRDRRARALADQAAASGEIDEAVRLARERVSLEPFSEEATRELMRRLTAVGDRAAALLAYDRLVERLRSELRTAPSAPTRALAEAVRGGEEDRAESPAVAESWLSMLDASARRSAFSGRDHELELLLRCVREQRRLALVSGDPGAGKTRLMLELGRAASSAGVSVLFGRCQQEPLAPYEPFAQGCASTSPAWARLRSRRSRGRSWRGCCPSCGSRSRRSRRARSPMPRACGCSRECGPRSRTPPGASLCCCCSTTCTGPTAQRRCCSPTSSARGSTGR